MSAQQDPAVLDELDATLDKHESSDVAELLACTCSLYLRISCENPEYSYTARLMQSAHRPAGHIHPQALSINELYPHDVLGVLHIIERQTSLTRITDVAVSMYLDCRRMARQDIENPLDPLPGWSRWASPIERYWRRVFSLLPNLTTLTLLVVNPHATLIPDVLWGLLLLRSKTIACIRVDTYVPENVALPRAWTPTGPGWFNRMIALWLSSSAGGERIETHKLNVKGYVTLVACILRRDSMVEKLLEKSGRCMF